MLLNETFEGTVSKEREINLVFIIGCWLYSIIIMIYIMSKILGLKKKCFIQVDFERFWIVVLQMYIITFFIECKFCR